MLAKKLARLDDKMGVHKWTLLWASNFFIDRWKVDSILLNILTGQFNFGHIIFTADAVLSKIFSGLALSWVKLDFKLLKDLYIWLQKFLKI